MSLSRTVALLLSFFFLEIIHGRNAISSNSTQDNSIEAGFKANLTRKSGPGFCKDIGISRFKILEGLFEEIKAESKPIRREIVLENLEEYDNSVSARYFLGMLALEQCS